MNSSDTTTGVASVPARARASAEYDAQAFQEAVLSGLSQPQKTLPCQYFYDARGSELFEQITALDEYYPTRTEAAILAAHAGEMAAGVEPGAWMIEFGSGSSTKTQVLLDAMPQLGGYLAIDVSWSALEAARARLRAAYPNLAIEILEADFTQPVTLDPHMTRRPALGFFPGSTIGNFEPVAASQLLAHFRRTLGAGARLIAGVDLRKPPAVLLPAYNDALGVTAAFNLNLLTRINRELSADIEVGSFRHEAVWNERLSRIEMHLVSLREQSATISGRSFAFRAGESIHTENSHKYAPEAFADLARKAGWTLAHVWRDKAGLFSVQDLRNSDGNPSASG